MKTESRTRTAMVFPGMGPSSFADVGKFMLINPHARKLVAVADDVLGYSLVDKFRDTEGDYSEYAQVAFLVNCLALAEWAEKTLDVVSEIVAGPSFGEKAATAYSGSLPVEDVILLTAQLARYLDDYFAVEHTDIVTHSFVRVGEERLADIKGELTDLDEWHEISCYVDDDFYMLTLREHNLEWLKKRLRAIGGLSLYTMRPPMHCGIFEPLRTKVAEELFTNLEFADPRIPVVKDQDGSEITTGAGVREMLLDGFVRPTRWTDIVATLKARGIERVCVAGADSLFSRVGLTRKNFDVLAVNPRMAMQPRRRAAVA
ncbi:[acyl-carrier-protein] S-malonyltransferase [Herbihabitans rhizosphaerae]|uniref:[acyl-carrier-protein] S-malonyltransferase n=1 Tax=Herbihabitans rhizosphaerae TaxID=1872711 RepID=A0A4Q7KFH2_9PSEU|nr:ACP S-malonyltransferase [Herbihabitans rhizosphaerae]RZS32710.1 [acyl-carrier-protein] S-malonyltransferase [Herbihabitans rhizosphaerae]